MPGGKLLFTGVLYGKYCGVWGFIPIQINIAGMEESNEINLA
jgi:uncharacterized membrane protein